MPQIKVLVVDDSALMRKVISDIFKSDSTFQVVATARDGQDALAKIERFKPDLLTLDVEMPRLNGLETLKKIMQKKPLPVIMVSSLTRSGSEVTIEALALGAFDFITKPGFLTKDISTIKKELLNKARMASGAKNLKHFPERVAPVDHWKIKGKSVFSEQLLLKDRDLPPVQRYGDGSFQHVVAIGSSTGGPRALEQVLTGLPRDFPAPIIITQHMPPGFTKALSERLNKLCAINIKEGERNDRLLPGLALLAPGGYHMTVSSGGRVDLNQGPPVEHVRPAVNVMMSSAVDTYGSKVIGVILTGMGKDGAEAMVKLKEKGGQTIVQDEDTCVIYSMPKAVVKQGAADKIVPLQDIAKELIAGVKREGECR